ncbi:MAG: gamma-glutamyl-gamma-aminobutyrate hydrolase family protein [Anaerolineales bacterium]
MSLPIIGITTRKGFTKANLPSISIQRAYTDSILRAGGAPLLIPSDLPEAGWRVVFDRLAGILFTGGGDIAVQRYGGEFYPKVAGVDEARDETELGLARLAAERGKPFLGICRGLQVLNVALGGTLYADIPAQVKKALVHNAPGGDGVPARTRLMHPVSVSANSRLAKILGVESLNVNSLHHQGVERLAAGLTAAAFAPDGIIEAVEIPGHPFGLAVQFHPEWLGDQEPIRRLWQSFVDACKQ